MNKKITLILVFLVGILLSGCTPKEVVVDDYPFPDGFAVYKRFNRAISGTGVMYRVRTQKNKPYAKLDFWKEALKKRMLDTGYTFIKDEGIKSGKKKGYLIELTAPYGEDDYTYMIAVFLKNKDDILIVEAAGEILDFKRERSKVVDAIKKIYN